MARFHDDMARYLAKRDAKKFLQKIGTKFHNKTSSVKKAIVGSVDHVAAKVELHQALRQKRFEEKAKIAELSQEEQATTAPPTLVPKEEKTMDDTSVKKVDLQAIARLIKESKEKGTLEPKEKPKAVHKQHQRTATQPPTEKPKGHKLQEKKKKVSLGFAMLTKLFAKKPQPSSQETAEETPMYESDGASASFQNQQVNPSIPPPSMHEVPAHAQAVAYESQPEDSGWKEIDLSDIDHFEDKEKYNEPEKEKDKKGDKGMFSFLQIKRVSQIEKEEQEQLAADEEQAKKDQLAVRKMLDEEMVSGSDATVHIPEAESNKSTCNNAKPKALNENTLVLDNDYTIEIVDHK
jgi:hypothetical protein